MTAATKQGLVLIFDKNRASALVLSTRLAAWGYSTELAHSVDDVISILSEAKNPPNLILAEILGPDTRALDLPALIAEKTRWAHAIPIAAHTALSDPGTIQEAISRGYVDYILRPAEPELMREKIRSLVSRAGQVSRETYALPVSELAVAETPVEITLINEFGFEALAPMALPANTTLELKSPLFEKIGTGPIRVRIASCAPQDARFRWTLSYVGLDATTLRRIRGYVLRAAHTTQEAQARAA